jgi:hypothetical protein
MFSYCYKFVGGEYSWSDGVKTCQRENAGANIVSILSELEEGYVFGKHSL